MGDELCPGKSWIKLAQQAVVISSADQGPTVGLLGCEPTAEMPSALTGRTTQDRNRLRDRGEALNIKLENIQALFPGASCPPDPCAQARDAGLHRPIKVASRHQLDLTTRFPAQAEALRAGSACALLKPEGFPGTLNKQPERIKGFDISFGMGRQLG